MKRPLATTCLVALLAGPLGGCLSGGPARTALVSAPVASVRTVRVPAALASAGADNAPGTLILGIQ